MSGPPSPGSAPVSAQERAIRPEVVSSVLTLGLAMLTLTLPAGPLSVLNVLIGTGIPVATTAILTPVVIKRDWLTGPAQQFLFVATVTWGVVCLTYVALLVVPTLPGILARQHYRNGVVVAVPESTRPGSAVTGLVGIGRGVAVFDGRTYAVRNDSELDTTITWFDSPQLKGDFYAEVIARRTDGPTNTTACALVFGRKAAAPGTWLEFDVSDTGAQLVQMEGKSAPRVLAGPLTLPYASDLASAHRLAVVRQGRDVTLLVDDHRALHASLGPGQASGAVTFGTVNQSHGPAEMECGFTSPRIRARSV